MESRMESRKLSEIIYTIIGQTTVTDIRIEPDAPIRVRRHAWMWEPVLIDAKPVSVNKSQIVAFVNGIYTGREVLRQPQAEPMLWEAHINRAGSLHPATIMGGPDGKGLLRVRCSIQRQNMGDDIALVVRPMLQQVDPPSALGVPVQAVQAALRSRAGLFVVTGPTGSGKSTTLASFIQELNRSVSCHIVTLEDPIEYEFVPEKAVISQREVAVDTPSFAAGVRDALRFAPDAILVGEVRDAETMRATLRAAESGHLVFCSMHAPTSVAALRKIVAYLESASDILSLSGVLLGVLAQHLAPVVEGRHARPLVLVPEYLHCAQPKVANAISAAASGDAQPIAALQEALRQGVLAQSIALGASVRSLFEGGVIDQKTALGIFVDAAERQEFASKFRFAAS